MNQARINRIKGVEKITEHGAALAKEAVQRCQNELAQQQERLQQLVQYFDEYAAGIGFATGGRAQAFALQNYRAFMERIEQTIAHQKTVCAQLEAELAAHRQAAAEANSQHRSVEKLRGRFETARDHQNDKLEQRTNDAHAAQHHRGPLGG